MDKKKLLWILLFVVLISIRLHAQPPDCNPDFEDCSPTDPGGTVPIPGILYFLAALLGIGIKKIYNARKRN